ILFFVALAVIIFAAFEWYTYCSYFECNSCDFVCKSRNFSYGKCTDVYGWPDRDKFDNPEYPHVGLYYSCRVGEIPVGQTIDCSDKSNYAANYIGCCCLP
ncbi:MAG: hypothetical protein MUP55_01530, partial [Candidatus Aenigmarchaeota archaeon]|nr:hypothetical protein [Candidatus Aenigmarchaeota archaeon]